MRDLLRRGHRGALAVRQMRAAKAAPFAKGFDTVSTLDVNSAANLHAAGYDFAVRYLGSLTAPELAAILGGGLACMPVTYADHLGDPTAQLAGLGLPVGVTVWLDVEAYTGDAPTLIARVNSWSRAVTLAGYEAGLYHGPGTPLDSVQLSALAVTRYWHSCSSLQAQPARGYCMRQLRPDDVTVAGVVIDVDIIEQDYRGDVPTWAVA